MLEGVHTREEIAAAPPPGRVARRWEVRLLGGARACAGRGARGARGVGEGRLGFAHVRARDLRSGGVERRAAWRTVAPAIVQVRLGGCCRLGQGGRRWIRGGRQRRRSGRGGRSQLRLGRRGAGGVWLPGHQNIDAAVADLGAHRPRSHAQRVGTLKVNTSTRMGRRSI